MSEPDIAIHYHERGTAAVYSVLIELGQVLGAYRDNFVIVGGAAALTESCRALLSDKTVVEGYQYIAGKFRHVDDFGPQTVRVFLAESDALGDMSPEQVQVDAYMQVSAWLKALGIAES